MWIVSLPFGKVSIYMILRAAWIYIRASHQPNLVYSTYAESVSSCHMGGHWMKHHPTSLGLEPSRPNPEQWRTLTLP